MNEFAHPQLAAWQSFYVIVGSAGGALIGIQFVVMTLIGTMRYRASHDTLGAFGTPTLVHLCGALVISAIMSAPWHSLGAAAVAIAACALGGLAYGVIVTRRARRQTGYEAVWQDWIWYVLLPFGAYVVLAIAAAMVRANTRAALYMVGGAALGLLLTGIHNAWDTVTHLIISNATAAADSGADARLHD